MRTRNRGSKTTGGARPKVKGATWERSCCKRISLWVSDVRRKDIFWRTAMSGGRSTLARRAKSSERADMVSGDLTCTHELGYPFLRTFCVECKWLRDVHWHRAVYLGTGELVDSWDQARDQTPPGRVPMLLLKEDRRGELLCVDSHGLRLLRLGIRRWSTVPVVVHVPHLDLHGLRLRDVLVRCSWSEVLRRRAPRVGVC